MFILTWTLSRSDYWADKNLIAAYEARKGKLSKDKLVFDAADRKENEITTNQNTPKNAEGGHQES